MVNQTITCLKISCNMFYGVMNPNMKFLVQIVTRIDGDGQWRRTTVSVYSSKT